MVSLFVACPERTITVLFPADYAPAASSLQILALGYFSYSLFFIMCSIITASGKPWVSLKLVVAAFAIQLTLCSILAKDLAGVGVASGTAIGMTVAVFLAHNHLKQAWGQGLSLGSLGRTVMAGVATGLMAHFLLAKSRIGGGTGILATLANGGLMEKLTTVFGFGVLALVFVVLLFVFGVLTSEDRARFGQVFKR